MSETSVIVDAFRSRWDHVNAMTTAFAAAVPDACWNSSPGVEFAPFCKQLRHVVCVRGVYNDGLRTGTVDFGRKHDQYDGSLTRQELMRALDAKHRELLALIAEAPAEIGRTEIDVFGKPFAYADYLYVYVQHEAIHHGQWSWYAARGGYETPVLWQQEWGL